MPTTLLKRGKVATWTVLLSSLLGYFDGSLQAQSSCSGDWSAAKLLEREERYEEAAAAYAGVLEECPDSQRAATLVAINRQKGNRETGHDSNDVLEMLEQSIAMDPYSRVWAEWGYLHKAQAHVELGHMTAALEAIGILKSRFPDSISTARAEVLEAELEGRSKQEAQQALLEEEAAEQMHERATAALRGGEYAEAALLFEEAIKSFPNSRKSLRSLEIKGLMHCRLGKRHRNSAIETFTRILDRVKTSTPHARIRYEAELRLGYLNLMEERQDVAFECFNWLASNAQDGRFSAEGSVQAAGAYFEMLQREQSRSGQPTESVKWDRLRTLCRDVHDQPMCSSRQRCRADLMYVESYQWQRDWRRLIPAGQKVLDSTDGDEFVQEIATLRLLLADALLHTRQPSKALPHLEWIQERYDDTSEIWSGMAHMERVLYLNWRALREVGAPSSEIEAAANRLLKSFPDGSFSHEIAVVSALRKGER